MDERIVSLAMWVKDVEPPTGASMGTAAEAQLQTNLDTLRRVFATDGTAMLKWTWGGTVRQGPAEVVNAVEFEPFGIVPYYRFVVEFKMADPLWQAENTYNSGTANLTTNPQNITRSNNGTYRNEHATITVITPLSGTVVDQRFAIGTDYVQYTGTVAESGTLAINMNAWTATNGTADVSGDITHDGDLVWLPIPTDSPEEARRLVKRLHGLRAKVNLIPFNDWPGSEFGRPQLPRILAFQAILLEHGITATIRWSKGEDVGAACGQLSDTAARAVS